MRLIKAYVDFVGTHAADLACAILRHRGGCRVMSAWMNSRVSRWAWPVD